uniref:Variant surface glycoprotein n=1 Tax=Trypanosoma brucei TaxID=5691 RepID=A0A1V0FYA1_9TRYP|nr:variant surface glycoprotein [Trypanosoma brucei]
MIGLLIKKGQTSTPTTGYCIVGSGANAALNPADDNIKCDTANPTFQEELAGYNGADFGPSGFKKLSQQSILDGTSHTNKCSFFKNTDTNTGTDSFHTNTPKTIFGGLVTITPAADHTATAELISNNALGQDYSSAASDTLAKKVYNALGELKKAEQGGCGTSAESIIQTILESNKLKEKVTAAVKAMKLSNKGKTPEETADIMVKEITGTTDNQATALQTAFTNGNVRQITDSDVQTKKVREISKTEDFIAGAGEAHAKVIQSVKTLQDTIEKAKQPGNKHTECEKYHNKSKECTDNGCKWKGGESGDKGECVVNTTQITEQAKQTGAGKDGAAKEGATTEKCTGKEQKECTGNCKWEDNKCKDSSFLLNKQFALSVVSAAFLALLF